METAIEAFKQACLIGNLPQIKQYVDAKPALIHAPLHQGWTVLHWACWQGHTDLVQSLLENKANQEAKTDDGMTPGIIAHLSRHEDIKAQLPLDDYGVKYVQFKKFAHWANLSKSTHIEENPVSGDTTVGTWTFYTIAKYMEKSTLTFPKELIEAFQKAATNPTDELIFSRIKEGKLTVLESGGLGHTNLIVITKDQIFCAEEDSIYSFTIPRSDLKLEHITILRDLQRQQSFFNDALVDWGSGDPLTLDFCKERKQSNKCTFVTKFTAMAKYLQMTGSPADINTHMNNFLREVQKHMEEKYERSFFLFDPSVDLSGII